MPATEREHASGPLGDAEYELLSTANEGLHGLWEAIWGR